MATAPFQRDKGDRYEDVSPLTSDAGSESEDEPFINQLRNSTELAKHDKELLREEEEREKLLTSEGTREARPGFFSRPKDGLLAKSKVKGTRRTNLSRRKRKSRKSSIHDEEGKLMYEMEEGGPRSETSSQASSSSIELNKVNPPHASDRRVS